MRLVLKLLNTDERLASPLKARTNETISSSPSQPGLYDIREVPLV